MNYNIFSLQPKIFESFFQTSLIARSVKKQIIQPQIINWREEFGKGNYKQVDDSPVGGGGSMVLQVEPIYKALAKVDGISKLFAAPSKPQTHQRIYPNNQDFFEKWLASPSQNKQATIMLTPRGFGFNQQISQWLASNFQTVNLLCGRYEGFDARVSEIVDLEISLGDFVLNGGEVAAMCLIESISRLLPGFITKENNYQHESFSTRPNFYPENEEFVVGSRNLKAQAKNTFSANLKQLEDVSGEVKNLFSNQLWAQNLPKIEHPQYAKPLNWQNFCVPEFLTEGNHRQIQAWKDNWYS
jgi:tRNA (guanine37-N1)-methyltransferase